MTKDSKQSTKILNFISKLWTTLELWCSQVDKTVEWHVFIKCFILVLPCRAAIRPLCNAMSLAIQKCIRNKAKILLPAFSFDSIKLNCLKLNLNKDVFYYRHLFYVHIECYLILYFRFSQMIMTTFMKTVQSLTWNSFE